MYDIHMHMIPGIGDGPGSFEEALAMLELAQSQGVEAVLAVPEHLCFERYGEVVAEGFERLKAMARARGLEIGLALGCEVRFVKGDMTKCIGKYLRNAVPRLNGRRVALVEFTEPFTLISDFFYVLQPLAIARMAPILANADQCLSCANYIKYAGGYGPKALAIELREKLGVRFQVNIRSLAGEPYPAPSGAFTDFARWLVDEKLADFVGTGANCLRADAQMNDFNGWDLEPWDLGTPDASVVQRGIRYILDHCAPEYAGALLRGNAQKLLDP